MYKELLYIIFDLHNSLTHYVLYKKGLPWWLGGKESTCQCRRCRFHIWVGKSPWRRNPLQYSCLENPMDRGGWWATVHGDTKSQKWLKQLSKHTHYGITHDLLYFYWTLVTFSTGGKYGLGAAHGHECLRACLDLPHSINLTRALLVHMPALEHLMLRWKRKSDYLVISRLKFLFWKLCHITYCLFQLKRSISKETSTRNRQNPQKSWEFPFRT